MKIWILWDTQKWAVLYFVKVAGWGKFTKEPIYGNLKGIKPSSRKSFSTNNFCTAPLFVQVIRISFDYSPVKLSFSKNKVNTNHHIQNSNIRLLLLASDQSKHWKIGKKWSAFYLNFGYSGWDKPQDNCRCQKFEKEQTKNIDILKRDDTSCY